MLLVFLLSFSVLLIPLILSRYSTYSIHISVSAMKITTALALSATASGVLGAVLPQQEPLTDHTVHVHHEPEKFLIELAPYQTRWVTEEEKWVLKLVCYYKPHLLRTPDKPQNQTNGYHFYRMASTSSMSPTRATQGHTPPSSVQPTQSVTPGRWNTATTSPS